ncbi:MAG: TRAP transporter small permease subunit [Bacteroidetes bacterium]|nr:MAG: TRAP transporter small permease subunit [Bacteroidota bacterium]
MYGQLISTLRDITRYIDKLIEYLGKGTSWLAGLLVVLVCYNVMMRYVFNSSKIYLTELEWHIFAAMFLLGAAYALQHEKHVRVDVFYSRFSPKTKAWVNLLGTLLFLIPFCLMVIVTSFRFARNSFLMREGSPDPAGLPALYVIKFTITLGFFFLLLQAISLLLKSGMQLLPGAQPDS